MVWLIGNKGMLGTDIELKLKKSGIEFVSSDLDVDITDYRALELFTNGKNITWIINSSAYTAVDLAEDEKEKAFAINADGVKNIAKIAKNLNASLIHFSTDYVFSGNKENGYAESDKTDPVSVYGKSKLAGENNIISETEQYFIIRISWLFGVYGKNFVYTMLNLFRNRDELKVVADQWGSPTSTDDVADLVIRIIAGKSSNYGIYHYSNEGKTNWYEFASTIFKSGWDKKIITKDVSIIPIPTEEYPTKAQRPKNSYFIKDKVKQSFNITIPAWQDALDNFFNKARENDTI